MEHISHLTNLTRLNLERLHITKYGILWLSDLNSLTQLELGGNSALTDDALEIVSKFTKIVHLDLKLCKKITDDGLQHLRSLTRLEKLSLEMCTKITDDGLLHLRILTRLYDLNLKLTLLTDVGLHYLPFLTNLQRLNLISCINITDEGLNNSTIGKLTKLHRLFLNGSSCSIFARHKWTDFVRKNKGLPPLWKENENDERGVLGGMEEDDE